MEETWAPVKDFEGLYEVSTHGQVRSLDRMVVGNKGAYLKRSQILKQWKQGNYLYCDLRKPGVKQKARIHVLVLETFVSARPGGMVACHNNGNSVDNRLENLRWGTLADNASDSRKHGTLRYGETCGTAKLSEVQALQILRSTKPNSQLAKDFGVCKATVSHIKTGRNWPHLQQLVTA